MRFPIHKTTRAVQDLFRLDGRDLDASSTFIGDVSKGELVYFEGAGEDGILVLIKGGTRTDSSQLVSMVDQIQINQSCHSRCLFD